MTRKHALLAFLLLLVAGLPVGAAYTTMVVPMEERSTATFYIDVILPDVGNMSLMVDTGAAYMTINEDMLKTMEKKGHAVFVRELSARLADGSVRDYPVYKVSEINIGGKCVIQNVEVAVLPGNTRCMLGLSALRKAAPFEFSMDPPQLRLSNCDTVSSS
ncbi:MAG: hypothetical protein BMS9Abin26_1835 [Gammaproteobacteria bacterium]|nr:MAG: hypothetical protein BMS9Abin26_1835 [Gammaproteobacteria bacterium]